MFNRAIPLHQRSAYGSVSSHAGVGSDVIAEDRDGLGLATLIARRGQVNTLRARSLDRLGIDPIDAPRHVGNKDLAFIGTGPATWLVMKAKAANALADELVQTFGDLASVSDQSDGYAVLRLRGARVRDVLSKLIPIDLHPDSFGVGRVAVTLAAHITVVLWRLENDRESEIYEVAVFRSLAESFATTLAESAAEYGYILIRNRHSE